MSPLAMMYGGAVLSVPATAMGKKLLAYWEKAPCVEQPQPLRLPLVKPASCGVTVVSTTA